MSRKELFKRLNALCKELDSKFNINCGGCCYVAACLAEQLELHNIPYTIVHYEMYSCHYAIKVSDRYLNRCDYYKKEIGEYLDCGSKSLFNIYYEGDWNETYNTVHNKIVRKRISQAFENYENRRT